MRARSSILLPRMRSAWLLLLSVLVSTLVAASLVAAFAGFSAATLPQALSSELLSSAHRSVTVSGSIDATIDRKDQPVVSASVRRAFGGLAYTAQSATWSDPISLPAPHGARTVPLVQAASMSQIRSEVRLTAGTWPSGGGRLAALPTVVPAPAAAALRLGLGQVLSLHDRLTGRKVTFRVTGFYLPVNPAATYWNLDLISPSGVSTQPGFITYGPLLVSGSAFSGGQLAIGGATWLYQLGSTKLTASQLGPLSTRIANAVNYLSGNQDLGGLQAASGLPALLNVVAAKLVVARSLLLVGELELLLLAAAALTLTARTLATQREEESATMSARGAGRRQLLLMTLSEALLITVLAAAAGAVLGSWLAGVLASTGSLHSAGLRVNGIPADDWWTAGAVLLLCTAVMIWPTLRLTSPGQARARRGRRAAVALTASAGADVVLVALAVLAGWQLRQFSLAGRTSGGVDPVLALAPAIALAAGTVLPLRLLPLLARAGDRLAARTRRFGGAMTSWELSRRAARQSAPMLLVLLATGTSTLALAQHESWRQSALSQAAFLAGADVRADTVYPATPPVAGSIAHAAGVTSAMAVSTALAGPGNGEVLAVSSRQGPAVALAPGGPPLATAWQHLAAPASPRFITLPGHPRELEVTASLAPGPGPAIGPVPVTVTVQDAAGVAYQVPAGLLTLDGRPHRLVAVLTSTGRADYPLRLLGISAAYQLPPKPGKTGRAVAARRVSTFTVSGLATSPGKSGARLNVLPATTLLARWAPGVAAPAFGQAASGIPPKLVRRSTAAPGSVAFQPGDGANFEGFYFGTPTSAVPGQVSLRAPPAAAVIPGVATTAFLHANQLDVGSVLQVTAGQATISVRIAGAVSSFPTVTNQAGGLIIDLAAAEDLVAAQQLPSFPVSQWWLATRNGAVPRGLPAGTAVTSAAKLADALLSDPMTVIPQQAVQATAIAAALLAALGFSVSVAGSVRERRAQAALLSALGVTGATQARLLTFEALALSLPAAATGLLLGAVLAHLLVPAVTITSAASASAIPALVRVPLTASVGVALIVTAIPVLAAAASAMYRPDPAAQLRAAEAA
jgi:hypothetical protein